MVGRLDGRAVIPDKTRTQDYQVSLWSLRDSPQIADSLLGALHSPTLKLSV